LNNSKQELVKEQPNVSEGWIEKIRKYLDATQITPVELPKENTKE
jgi:hypothetical protein